MSACLSLLTSNWCCRISHHTSLTMDLDDDAPPELIDTGATGPEIEEVTVKVPITIVTGIPDRVYLIRISFYHSSVSDSGSRVSRRRQDDAAELHTHSRAWQKDCSHYERFVRFFSRGGSTMANLKSLEFGDCE